MGYSITKAAGDMENKIQNICVEKFKSCNSFEIGGNCYIFESDGIQYSDGHISGKVSKVIGDPDSPDAKLELEEHFKISAKGKVYSRLLNEVLKLEKVAPKTDRFVYDTCGSAFNSAVTDVFIEDTMTKESYCLTNNEDAVKFVNLINELARK